MIRISCIKANSFLSCIFLKYWSSLACWQTESWGSNEQFLRKKIHEGLWSTSKHSLTLWPQFHLCSVADFKRWRELLTLEYPIITPPPCLLIFEKCSKPPVFISSPLLLILEKLKWQWTFNFSNYPPPNGSSPWLLLLCQTIFNPFVSPSPCLFSTQE